MRRLGSVLVEFALVAPVILALLIGIIDMGFMYEHQLILTNAAREGARVGAMGYTATQVRDRVVAYLTASGYAPMPATADIVIDLAGGLATVRINSTVPFLFAKSGPALTLKAETRMRTE